MSKTNNIKEETMIYKSENGYTGMMLKGRFMGIKHWDSSILDPDKHLVYHATLSDPMPHKDFKREVDDFPLTLEVLNSIHKEDDDGEE